MLLMIACGYGECRILPMSMPDMVRSSAYLPWPVVLPAESTRAMGLPMTEKLFTCLVHRRDVVSPVRQHSYMFALLVTWDGKNKLTILSLVIDINAPAN